MPVPNNIISIFQSLHLTVDRCCKAFLRKNAQDWYSNEIRKEIDYGMQAHAIKVDVCISVLKPLRVSWVTKFYNKMPNVTYIILNGWKRPGIINAISSETEKDNPYEVQFYLKKL